jgi:Asp-tRNA(Asn)/Glu-tRNA(Gln) amidotransferase A subunit family amidase
VELTRLALGRCATYNPRLSCIVTVLEERALAEARWAEDEIMAGRYLGPLHGLPWGIKDMFATRGAPTTCGRAEWRNRVIELDATVVERLHDAGAVLIAKLSLHSDRQGPWFGGRTRNPWDPTVGVADGSSAGPASATAAGLVAFSIGEENSGSILWPAYYCGVVGLRPTFGRVSRFGSPLWGATMGKVGPLCREVEDCAAAFAAIYGPDGKDWTVADAPFTWAPTAHLSGRRVGYVHSEFAALSDEEEGRLYAGALDVLRSLGAQLEPMDLPYTDLDDAAARFMKWAEDTWEADVVSDPDGAPSGAVGVAATITAVDFLQAQCLRTAACQEMARLFVRYDVLVYPGIGERCMWATNWMGLPALQVPCGFVGGMPRGITFVGRAYDEAGLLAVGWAYEQATTWHTRHPPLP